MVTQNITLYASESLTLHNFNDFEICSNLGDVTMCSLVHRTKDLNTHWGKLNIISSILWLIYIFIQFTYTFRYTNASIQNKIQCLLTIIYVKTTVFL